jgi:hypothetical protein
MTSVSERKITDLFILTVYIDKCVADNEFVARHLSENVRLHNYGETAPEALSFLIAMLADCLANDPEKQAEVQKQVDDSARVKHSAYVEIVRTRALVHALIAYYPMKKYYVTTSLFKPFDLYKRIGVYGGVSAICILRMIISNQALVLIASIFYLTGKCGDIAGLRRRHRLPRLRRDATHHQGIPTTSAGYQSPQGS